VIAVTAVRTGCGKSPVSRHIAARLAARGLRTAVLRHPMPYGDLARQDVQRFASFADLDAAACTIEEREEYEPYVAANAVIYAGVDAGRATEALQAILEELSRLRDEPVPETELNKAREYLKGRLVLGLEDSFSQTAWVASQALLMERIKTPAEVLQAYDTITVADVQAIAQKIINPARYSLAAVGPFGDGAALGKLLAEWDKF